VAVLTGDLEIVLVRPHLAPVLAPSPAPADIEGRNLLDLIPRGRATELLGLVARQVAREVRIPAPGAAGVSLVVRVFAAQADVSILVFAEPWPAARATPRPPEVVGRGGEIAELESFLADEHAAVLHVVGPLGIGKSALLRRFVEHCEELRCPCALLDARAIAGAGSSIEPAASASRLADDGTPRGRRVLLIDNVDALNDPHTLERFLRVLPECRIVTASRQRPLREDWAKLRARSRMIALGPLPPAEAMALARASTEDVADAERLVQRAGGHPIMLSTPRRTRDASFRLELELTLHRDFLEAGAIPARVTEDTLVALLEDGTRAPAAYTFLEEICVPARDGFGLRMPEPFREAVLRRLRERNPNQLASAQARLAAHYGSALDLGSASNRTMCVDDFLDAFADHPALADLIEPMAAATARVADATPDDADRIVEAITALGASSAAATLRRRLEHPRYRTWYAEREGRILGVLQCVIGTLGQMATASSEVDDDALADVVDVLQNRGHHAYGEVGLAAVLALCTESTDAWGPNGRALYRQWFRALFATPRGVFGAFAIERGDEVAFPPFSLRPTRVVRVGSRTIIVRDLRAMSRRKLFVDIVRSAHEQPAPIGEASTLAITPELVRHALEHLDDAARLQASPLVALRAVETEAGPDARPEDRAAALARLVRHIVTSLSGDAKLRAILVAVFLERSGKHEAIAHDLAIPYGTFRRHLGRAVERVAESLHTVEHGARLPALNAGASNGSVL
jgi:hypothetical protein